MKEKIRRLNFCVIVLLFILLITSGCGGQRIDDIDAVNQKSKSFTIPVVYGDGINKILKLDDVFSNEDNNKIESISLQKILNSTSGQLLSVYTKGGEIIDTDTSRCMIYKNGQITVNDKKINDIVGFMVEPPVTRVMDTAKLAEKFLKENEPVLIIFLDGFSWNNYEKAKADGLIPNISQFKDIKKATTIFPPITPVGYAAMVSGETPSINGIKNRNVHILNCDTIFDKAETMGKKTCVIEGDGVAIELATEVILNPDSNENGLTDDEVHVSAMEKLRIGNYDLMLIHLHGIDDTSHSYGPDSPETYKQIAEIDKIVADFLKLWEGNVIIVADHGQHTVNEPARDRKGNHGDFCPEDMFIPFIFGEVGK